MQIRRKHSEFKKGTCYFRQSSCGWSNCHHVRLFNPRSRKSWNAIFPGAWNPHAATAACVELRDALTRAGGQGGPDVWSALGFDFVRFASALNLDGPGWTPSVVNERLAAAQLMDWSMAPIRWGGGRAAQEMFIFHPTASGFEPVDEKAFKQRRDEIRARYARRRR